MLLRICARDELWVELGSAPVFSTPSFSFFWGGGAGLSARTVLWELVCGWRLLAGWLDSSRLAKAPPWAAPSCTHFATLVTHPVTHDSSSLLRSIYALVVLNQSILPTWPGPSVSVSVRALKFP